MKLLRYYLQVFLPLVVAFAAYQTWAVPFFEPKPRELANRWLPSDEPVPQGAKWWEPFFLEGAWQRNQPLVIERDECILLYQQREQISDTRWRFKPLTIVIPQKTAGGERRAIFIENPQGAEIQFKKPFDWTSGNPPPIVNGQLLGDIKIYAPGDDSSQQGELLIETKDMRIDRRQVWTTEPIQMRIGNSSIEGRYLSIYMDRDLLAEQSATVSTDPTPFPGLDYLELFYVDRVNVVLPRGGLWPSQQTANGLQRPASASLRCGGTFVFQFHQSLATLKNGVHMEHRVEGLPVDTFDCNELKLTLGMEKAPETTSQNTEASSERWRIDRLEAIGAPGQDYSDQSNWVRMKAPGMQAEAQGQHLVMDFVHGMVTLSNALPGTAPRHSSRVYLRRESLQVSSPHLQVQNPDLIRTSGQPQLHRLGWLIADGIGIAQMETADDSWALRWSKRLVIRPHETRDLIQIEGGANISSSQRGRFIAENLNLWVLPVEGELADRLAWHYPDGKLPQFVPDLIQAKGDVMVTSPELNAQVETMNIRFQYPNLKPNRPGDHPLAPIISNTSAASIPSSASPPGSAATLESNAMRDEASTMTLAPPSLPLLTQPDWPTSVDNRSPAGSIAPQIPRSPPFQVQGISLEAEVIRTGKESSVASMVLDGDFALSRESISEETSLPLRMTGSRLVFHTPSDEWTNIHVIGQPAKVAVGSGWIMSDELQLSQTDQLFWIDHPGELVVPVEALALGGNASETTAAGTVPGLLNSESSRNGGAMEWHAPPRLQWGEYMTFDGKLARFGGGVTIDCRMKSGADTLWHILASASTMTLEMAKPVPLRYQALKSESEGRAKRSQPELRIVRLDGDVDIKAAQTDRQGVRQSTENLLLPRIEFNVPTQNWVGIGPGQLWSRRLGMSNPLDSVTSQLNAAAPIAVRTPGPVSAGSPTLQCLHLTFLGRVEGSMQRRMVSFYDKIDSLLGPIRDWDESVDVRFSETLQPNQSRLLCDQLNLFDAAGLSYQQARLGPKQAAWEIDALGNAQLASRTDSGDVVIDANRIGYAAVDDAVRIEGTSRRGATIRRLPMGEQRREADEFQVSSATMRLKTGQLDAQIRRIEGALPPQFQRPVDPPPTPSTPNRSLPPGANGPGSALPSPRDFNPLQPRSNGR